MRAPRYQRAMTRSVALGFRAHLGWTAAVAVAGTPGRPEILARRRIELVDPTIARAGQPYHAAAELPFDEAKRFVARCERAVARLATAGVAELVHDLTAQGLRIAGCGVVIASGRALPPLASILASHPLIHAAEGEHVRRALVQACEHAGLPVARVPERTLAASVAKRFRTTVPALQADLTAAGKPLGAPWTTDQKLAALVAWLVLAER